MVTEHHTNDTHVIPKLKYESDNGKVIGQKIIFEKKKILTKMFSEKISNIFSKKIHKKNEGMQPTQFYHFTSLLIESLSSNGFINT